VKERVMRINENLLAFKSISSPGAKISFLRPSQKRREWRFIQRIKEKMLYTDYSRQVVIF
jgi:hypothetical protein